nr:non-LTR retroelement reverse transcriptase [Tanacetum cinerariifolium]
MLNTNGTSRGNPGYVGGGEILRDDRGHFIRAFDENYGICTFTISELLAIMRGITMAIDIGIKKFLVKVDSQVVVQLIECHIVRHNNTYFIVKKYRDLLENTEWEVKLEHCYREANRAADWLTNHGCEQEEILLMFDSAPPNLGLILLEDIKGVLWHRSIVAS